MVLYPGAHRAEAVGPQEWSDNRPLRKPFTDSTLRKAFDDYCQSRVNIAGETLGFDADCPGAQAEWVKHRLAEPMTASPTATAAGRPNKTAPTPMAA